MSIPKTPKTATEVRAFQDAFLRSFPEFQTWHRSILDLLMKKITANVFGPPPEPSISPMDLFHIVYEQKLDHYYRKFGPGPIRIVLDKFDGPKPNWDFLAAPNDGLTTIKAVSLILQRCDGQIIADPVGPGDYDAIREWAEKYQD